MHLKFTIAVLLATSCSLSWAGPCDKLLANDQLVDCLGREFTAVDARLNRIYGQLRNRLSGEKKETLRKGEIAWLSYRDAHCELLASGAAGGQGYQPMYISCQASETARRVRELQELAKSVPQD